MQEKVTRPGKILSDAFSHSTYMKIPYWILTILHSINHQYTVIKGKNLKSFSQKVELDCSVSVWDEYVFAINICVDI